MVDLGTLGGENSAAGDVNNNGVVIGWSITRTQQSVAFVWTAQHGMTNLGTLGGSNSNAMAINDNNQIVGEASTPWGKAYATLWEKRSGAR